MNLIEPIEPQLTPIKQKPYQASLSLTEPHWTSPNPNEPQRTHTNLIEPIEPHLTPKNKILTEPHWASPNLIERHRIQIQLKEPMWTSLNPLSPI